ncbi:hypothetical protein ACIBHX_24255 [Nonomuraea sp. NPDC050536]|uniref:hypothetical protein n=1 Tax=Nonomuraea sp. NPDC050536 TaxID=3364366 RepID=UPI0037C87B02
MRAEIHAREDDLPTAIELSGEAVEALRAQGPDGAGLLAIGLRQLGGYLLDVNLPQEAVTVLRECWRRSCASWAGRARPSRPKRKPPAGASRSSSATLPSGPRGRIVRHVWVYHSGSG